MPGVRILTVFVFQALYVEDGNEDDGDESQPPATAQEYLRRVMKEAKQVDFVGIGNFSKKIYNRCK